MFKIMMLPVKFHSTDVEMCLVMIRILIPSCVYVYAFTMQHSLKVYTLAFRQSRLGLNLDRAN